MEMANEMIRTLRDYFTIKDNEIVCDFCSNTYDIIVRNVAVEKHLKDNHEDKHKEYENAVSSQKHHKSKQEYWKTYCTIDDNTIKCKHCEHLYISWNTHSILKYHLGVGHNICEDKVKKFREWIGEKYKLNDSDRKQYCNKCQTGIQNKPKQLIDHLTSHHKDIDCSRYKPSERLPNRLDNIFDNWIWNYYIRDGEYAYCSVCEKNSVKRNRYLKNNTDQIKYHIQVIHKDKEFISLKSAKVKSKECDYYYIQDGQVKCKLCNTTKQAFIYIQTKFEDHLELKHEIKSDQSDILRNWVFRHFRELPGFQKSYCNYCDTTFQKMCPYSLFEHLLKYHRIKMFPEYSPMGESSNSGSLLRSGNVRSIFIPSMNPQPGSSKPSGIEVRDVDCDRDNTMGNLKRKSSNSSDPSSSGENVKDFSISSVKARLGSNITPDIEVSDVDCDGDNTIKNLKRKLCSLSSSDKNVKDISISSGEPQAGSSKDLDTDDRDSGMKKVKHDDDKRPLTDWPVLSEGIDPIRYDDLYDNYIYYNEDTDDSETSDI